MQALLSKFCAVFSKLQLHSHTNNNSQHSKLKFLVPVATYCAIIIIIINNGVRPLTRHSIIRGEPRIIIIHVKTASQEDA